MAHMSIFDNDAFSMVEMAEAFEETEFLPQELEEYFEVRPVRTKNISIENQSGKLVLIPVSKLGSPIMENVKDTRQLRTLQSVRLAQGDTITADEIDGVRAFGTDSEFVQMQKEVADRIGQIDVNMSLSFEACRLGAVQGLMIDPATGDTIYDYFLEFGVTQEAEVDFDLDNASPAQGALLKKCNEIKRKVLKNSKGGATPKTRIKVICGANFWDDLVTHKHVEKTYENWMAAQDLRGKTSEIYGSMTFGGLDFSEYRGTDDDTTVAVGVDKCIIFPVGVRGNLVHAQSPASEFIEFVNTKGKKRYPMIEPDQSKNKKFVRVEEYAYPLFYVTRPKTLMKGKRT